MKNLIRMIYLSQHIKSARGWLSKSFKEIQKGSTFMSKYLDKMDRKIKDDSEELPNKKLCTEKTKEEAQTETFKRVKTKKVVFLLSYLGSNYYGMQKNNGFKTIEGELLVALHKANLINDSEFKEPSPIQLQITARTDKGVSAVKQVVCLKIAEHCTVEAINKHLPEDIRLLSIKRVTKGFSCTGYCTARTYSYTLPTYAFAPELHKEYPENYRIDEETLQKVNEMLLLFIGTHNFHNFTSKKSYGDPSAKRYIMTFRAEKPFVQGEEFITLKVKGQSFMMHQIRKMVGHVIKTVKGLYPSDIEPNDIFSEKKVSIPKAPGLGLMLENIHFDRYNNKYSNDGIHESLDWSELENEVNFFKQLILANIIKKEVEEKSMFNWLQYLLEDKYYNQQVPDNSEQTDIKSVVLEESKYQ